MSEEFEFDEEMVREVVTEGLEGLDSVVPLLMELQDQPDDLTPITGIFRSFHSIKGNAGMVGLDGIAKFAHRAENALNKLREGELKVNEERIQIFVQAADILTTLLQGIDYEAGAEVYGDAEDAFLLTLEAAFSGEGDDPESSILKALHQWIDEAKADPALENHPKIAELTELIEKASATEDAPPEEEEEASEAPEAAAPPAKDADSKSLTAAKPFNSNLRVDVVDFDNIMKLGGELFNIDERLKFWIHDESDSEANSLHRNVLRGIARDFDSAMDRLYKSLLGIQKVPIAQLTRPLERIVRDVCRTQGKKIQIALIGDDLRLDKQLLEMLHDPLVHMIRNSVDHGVETPAERVEAGKTEDATIHLGFSEGEETIEVMVRDDGRGIDLDAVKAKAVKQGMVTAEEAEALSEMGQIELIYRAGLSTKDKVSDLSGRGVGMDVVISNLRQEGGSIRAETKRGSGTTFTIELPKPGSPVVEGLAVRIGQVNYLLPLKNVNRFMAWEEVHTSELPTGEKVANLVEGCLPMIELEGLQGTAADIDSTEGAGLVIEDRLGERYVMHVDEVIGRQKALVVGIDKWLEGTSILNGAFMLGNGSIGFTICVEKLSERIVVIRRNLVESPSGTASRAAA